MRPRGGGESGSAVTGVCMSTRRARLPLRTPPAAGPNAAHGLIVGRTMLKAHSSTRLKKLAMRSIAVYFTHFPQQSSPLRAAALGQVVCRGPIATVWCCVPVLACARPRSLSPSPRMPSLIEDYSRLLSNLAAPLMPSTGVRRGMPRGPSSCRPLLMRTCAPSCSVSSSLLHANLAAVGWVPWFPGRHLL